MISLHDRSKSALWLPIALLCFGLLCSCKTKVADPRDDLVRSLKGANVDGYYLATEEDDTQVIASLTNRAVLNLVRLDSSPANLVLRYTSVKDKSQNSTRTYKSEITRTGAELTLLVTDIATREVVSRTLLPAPELHDKTATNGQAPGFNTLEDCIKDFNCTRRGALQCEADSTCQDQSAALTCCLNNGQCFSVHLVITPATARCTLRDLVPNLGGLVLSQ